MNNNNNNKGYVSKIDINKALSGDISFGLIEKGVSATAAFGLANALMFLRRGKTERINHNKQLSKQLEEKFNVGLFNKMGFGTSKVQKINSAQEVLEYMKLDPHIMLVEPVNGLMDLGYDHIGRAGGHYHLIRTNHSGHKILRTQNLNDYLGFS